MQNCIVECKTGPLGLERRDKKDLKNKKNEESTLGPISCIAPPFMMELSERTEPAERRGLEMLLMHCLIEKFLVTF